MVKGNTTRWLTRTAILLAVALVFQLGSFPQPVTGPVINLVLYLSALITGMVSGIIIGLFTPLVASLTGILPAALAPMIPFIVLGNVVLVIIFSLLKEKNIFLAVGLAAVAKFMLLAGAVEFLVDVPPGVSRMMTFPQLLTALGGGVLAVIVYKALQNNNLV